MRRALPSHPGYEIDHDGNVWSVLSKPAKKLPHGTHQNRHETVHLTVEIEGTRHFIWRLLGAVIYGGCVVVARDGNFLNLRRENVIELRTVSSTTITDVDQIHLIWRLYCGGMSCVLMGGHSGLIGFWTDDFKSVVRDVLWAGVR